jgi:hypothetical protein
MSSFPQTSRSWHGFPAPLAAIGLAFLPKCPLCFALILSAAGLGFPSTAPWLSFCTGALAAWPLLYLLLRARRTRNWLPFALGASAALAAVTARFADAPAALTIACGLIAASACVWSARTRACHSPLCRTEIR